MSAYCILSTGLGRLYYSVKMYLFGGVAEWATKGKVVNLSISSHLVGNQSQGLERGIYMAKDSFEPYLTMGCPNKQL